MHLSFHTSSALLVQYVIGVRDESKSNVDKNRQIYRPYYFPVRSKGNESCNVGARLVNVDGYRQERKF